MATYFVEINARFLVRINYDGSAGGAEHHFLDNYIGVWGALAYDEKTMKTDCFKAALLNDELISEVDLATLMSVYAEAKTTYDVADKKKKSLQKTIDELERQLNEARAQYNEALDVLLKAQTEKMKAEVRCHANRPV